MFLKYFIFTKDGELSLDSIPNNEAELIENRADFVRWIDSSEPVTLVPPAPYASMKEYTQELARQSDLYWRGR